jgi:hypothetical protein
MLILQKLCNCTSMMDPGVALNQHVSQPDVHSSTTRSCEAHLMLTGMITHREAKLG